MTPNNPTNAGRALARQRLSPQWDPVFCHVVGGGWVGRDLSRHVGLKPDLRTTKARGIGLGLVVVKNLTQANGGRTGVQSEVGRGTIFTVTLPAVQVGRGRAPARPADL
jgi:nitrogen-specific signal transduction histidine kinase